MEQKRTLWILIASGVFLCVVIGTAFILAGPSSRKNNTAVTVANTDGNGNSLWVTPGSSSQKQPSSNQETALAENVYDVEDMLGTTSVTNGLSAPSEGQTSLVEDGNSAALASAGTSFANGAAGSELASTGAKNGAQDSDRPYSADNINITSENTNIYTTNVYNSQNETASASAQGNQKEYSYDVLDGQRVAAKNDAARKAMAEADLERESGKQVIAKTLDESGSSKSGSSSAKSNTSSSAKSTGSKTESKAADSSAKSSGAKSSGATAKTDSKAKSSASSGSAVAPSASSTRIPDRYWVQVASYSEKKKADEARELLDQNKIQCEVFTFEKETAGNSALYYRVRVGPYTTRDEAAYWKKQIDAISMFESAGSFIVNSSAPLAKK